MISISTKFKREIIFFFAKILHFSIRIYQNLHFSHWFWWIFLGISRISSETLESSRYFNYSAEYLGVTPPIINYSAELIIAVEGSVRKLAGSSFLLRGSPGKPDLVTDRLSSDSCIFVFFCFCYWPSKTSNCVMFWHARHAVTY